MPPNYVILLESASANCGAGPQPSAPTLSATDGLGGTPTTYISSYQEGRSTVWDGYSTCSTSRYTVTNNPGTTFPVTCSPQATANGKNAHAFVSYQVKATPVFVVLSGVVDAVTDSPKVLTGQGVRASLSAGDFSIVSTSYNWAVTGDIFNDYEHGTVGRIVPFAATAYTQSFWLWIL